jgi:hypothetical protein
MRTLIASLFVGLLLCAGPVYAQNQQTPAKARATTPEIQFDSVRASSRRRKACWERPLASARTPRATSL